MTELDKSVWIRMEITENGQLDITERVPLCGLVVNLKKMKIYMKRG